MLKLLDLTGKFRCSSCAINRLINLVHPMILFVIGGLIKTGLARRSVEIRWMSSGFVHATSSSSTVLSI